VNRFVPSALGILLGSFVLPGNAARAAGAESRPIVPGYERFYRGEKADAARGGQLLLRELSCQSCHASTDPNALPKQPPILDSVGGRVRVSWLRKFLADPHATKPGTPMPALFGGDPERDKKVEALVHFLASTGSLRKGHAERRTIVAGRDLYHKVGCVACHGPRDAAGKPEAVDAATVPTADLPQKYSFDGLAAFLEHPLQSRPSGRMPQLLAANEAKAVANYLLQGASAPVRGMTNYAYYEGSWDRIPDFSKLKPVSAGTVSGFDLTGARRGDNYALRFEGYFDAKREGTYSFTLHSDDGSRLYVDDKSVVDNDGIHPPSSAKGAVQLTAGVHKVTVAYFQGGGGAELEVTVNAPGEGRFNLGDVTASTAAALKEKAKPAKSDDPEALEIRPEMVEKGRALFSSAGCASCHQLSEGKQPLPSTVKAPSLNKLHAGMGCLSAAPPKGLPSYGLDAKQRQALASALAAPAPAETPAEVITATMTAFNCYACHVRDKVGGLDPAFDRFVQTTQPEMGEEARVPPLLDGVGAKLTTEYLRELLDRGGHHRPYMHTHMPGFGIANVGKLVAAFEALDHLPEVPAVTFAQSLPRVKDTARFLSSGQAYGCVKCHTFAGIKAEGVQGIDMTLMTRRLRRDWFHVYLLDPQRIRPGTRMPSAFYQGKSALPEVLDGKPATQIEALWVYLQDGAKARPPAGMGTHSIPLVPEKTALIYRNFIEGAGPRAIAVGYPEKVNLAFDANDVRMAMIWQGAFIDAGRHWTDRGVGFEGPAGDNILPLPVGAAFAVLGKPDKEWPVRSPKEAGYRFLGYRLTPDERPTFRYALGDLTVEDFPEPSASKEPSLRRTLTVTGARSVDYLFFRAAVADKIEDAGGAYQVDGNWKLKVATDAKPIIRHSAGKDELLVPVRFADGKARLVLEYAW
jgi:mono/diheme cytochrome c family protein